LSKFLPKNRKMPKASALSESGPEYQLYAQGRNQELRRLKLIP